MGKITKSPKKALKKKKFLKRLSISISIIIIILSLPTFFYIYFLDRVYPNVYIAGIDLTGKTENEISTLLAPEINPPKSTTLNYNDNVFNIDVNSLNLGFNKSKTVEKALKLGRTGNVANDIIQILNSLTKKTYLPLELSLNENVIDSSIQKIESKINIDPQNAKFTFANERVQNFSVESKGLKVNPDKLKEEIVDAIKKNDGAKISIDVPTQVVDAQIKTSDVNNLGIIELIGSGTSHFAGSASSRVHNIALGTSRINNALVAPGEIFSFDKTVGDISILTGYQQAYIIQNGQTVLGDGGGICQVSTTLFRAAMNSGLPIVARTAHAYRVHYYEEDAAPGFDATVYSPSVDFQFKNDTANYILIQSQIDLYNLVLTFNIYGTGDGRTVNTTKPVLWDYQSAPAPLYTEDPTLPIGQIKQVDFAAPGTKSSFDYTVTRNGEVINHQTFYSDFHPWQAKFLKGTKV